MLSLKKIAFAALLPLSAAGLTVAAIALNSGCAYAGQCGECYDTGRPGHNVQRGKYSDCDVCFLSPGSEALIGSDRLTAWGTGKEGHLTGSGTVRGLKSA